MWLPHHGWFHACPEVATMQAVRIKQPPIFLSSDRRVFPHEHSSKNGGDYRFQRQDDIGNSSCHSDHTPQGVERVQEDIIFQGLQQDRTISVSERQQAEKISGPIRRPFSQDPMGGC
jgi:hypothetical protein